MATPRVKTTYALDPETVLRLELMARRWGVSKSEALRRAIHAAATQPKAGTLDATRAPGRAGTLAPAVPRGR